MKAEIKKTKKTDKPKKTSIIEFEPCSRCGSRDIGFILDSTRRMKCQCCGNYGPSENSTVEKDGAFTRSKNRWDNIQRKVRDSISKLYTEICDKCSECKKYEKYEHGEREFNNCSNWLCNDNACPNDKGIDNYHWLVGTHGFQIGMNAKEDINVEKK
jgi:hypothetical protein